MRKEEISRLNVNLGVLTGGPLAGKTTVTKAVEGEWSEKMVIAPEVPTVLLEHLVPPPGNDFTGWLENLQHMIYPTQRRCELIQLQRAQERGHRLVLCDRGVLDGAAYVPGGMDQFCSLLNIDPDEELARYAFVIHLESVATANPALWDVLKGTNPARYETLDQAIGRELALRKVYEKHPNYHFISGKDGIEAVVAQVMSILSDLLDTEIERKWLLEQVPEVLRLDGYPSKPVRQGYFTPADSSAELRIREMGPDCFITVKGGAGLSRKEWERSLPKAQFDALWPQTKGMQIKKTRYYIPDGRGHLIEFDRFSFCTIDGLILFEVEFNDEQEARSYQLPSWAAGAVDVTHDKRYKNKALAA